MLPAPLLAQAYPIKPIRMILPFPPGGPTDITGRTIAQKLSEQLGQAVVPENRPGAAGNLGLELGAKAPPDGYTITLAAPPLAVSPSLYAKLNYDAVRDFAPVSLVAAIHNIMVVHNSVPAKNLKEFIRLAQTYPGRLNFSSSGAGSTNHLASELLKGRYKLDMVHVPYKGAALALVALMSGQVDMGIMAVPPAIPHVQANKVRALCVLTERREPQLPNVPTSKEAGVDDFVMPIWYGILAPAGTPREIVNRLNSEIHKALASADLKQRFANAGVEPLPSTPEHFAGFIKSEMVRYAKVIKDAGIRIE
jgi:tripartite-type tricarboxylate transporter receptor subunit TctC